MSWAIGYDGTWARDIGYGVPATCDHPGCGKRIDRGLGYVCGGHLYGGEYGCGLYLCEDHLYVSADGPVCTRCLNGEPPYTPTPDVEEWTRHKHTDPSWATWRTEHGIPEPGPVMYDQTILADDPTGEPGDCLRACVATLLQTPITRVPNFADFADWRAALSAWRPSAGLWPIDLAPGYWPKDLHTPNPWVIGIVPSPRGLSHAVILDTKTGDLVHDPHPSRTGLTDYPGMLIVVAQWAVEDPE